MKYMRNMFLVIMKKVEWDFGVFGVFSWCKVNEVEWII